nr:hypothetical protein [uncultured Flavobacterium sp.]
MKITLPDGWHEVKISQFQEIAELPEDAYRDNTVLEILADTEGLENISVDSRIKCINQISWVFNPPSENEYKRVISIDGVDFFLRNYRDLKIGERIDLKEYTKNGIKNLHKIAAILYKPEKEVKNAELLFQEKVNVQDVYGSLVFFWNIANRSTKIMQTYLMEEMSQKMKQKKKKQSD